MEKELILKNSSLSNSDKRKSIPISWIHYTVKRKLQESCFFDGDVNKFMDEYFKTFWKTIELLLKKGYSINLRGVFTIKVNKNGTFNNKKAIRGYIKLGNKFKKSIINSKTNIVVELYDKNTGKKVKL